VGRISGPGSDSDLLVDIEKGGGFLAERTCQLDDAPVERPEAGG
jgi:hypothetical protein